jgi:cutinase
MKSSAAYIIALARLSTASPLPQFSLPSLGGGGGGLPSLGGSGDGFPSLGGGGGGLPSLGGGGGLPSLGGGGFGLPSFPEPSGGLGGLSIPSFPGLTAVATADNSGTSPTSVQVSTTGGSHPVATSAPGSGTIGSGCRPQNGGGLGSENGVTDKNCCTDLTVIFARGTGELGNVGTVTGPPMFKALRSKLGANNVTIQGVDYPASAGVSKDSTLCGSLYG